MLGVTADTNVYVIRLSISDAILQETIRVLGDKFQWEEAALREVDATIRSIAEVVAPTQAIDAIKSDPPDNRVLECAAEAKSDYIVSGDRDLLNLGASGIYNCASGRAF